jgi:predicted O-linked N-acetylglucosamine transferase (SPINDLY family)
MIIELWSSILKDIPRSRLIMKARALSDRTTCEYVLNMFGRKDIGRDRIELLSWEPLAKGHLATYNRIDIGLDTFPYAGTTTTCEAMWMGVPVITLAGNTHVSRVGVSLLSNVGLKELVAQTPEEYVEIAVNLARNMNRLLSLRTQLRDMMTRSSLTNANQFTRNIEDSYLMMWEKWCKSA